MAIRLGDIAPDFTAPTTQGDILEDIELIENLEQTKKTSIEIEEKVKLAKLTEISIAKAREVYRPVATRGSLVSVGTGGRVLTDCVS